jgi:hypothetical protein
MIVTFLLSSVAISTLLVALIPINLYHHFNLWGHRQLQDYGDEESETAPTVPIPAPADQTPADHHPLFKVSYHDVNPFYVPSTSYFISIDERNLTKREQKDRERDRNQYYGAFHPNRIVFYDIFHRNHKVYLILPIYVEFSDTDQVNNYNLPEIDIFALPTYSPPPSAAKTFDGHEEDEGLRNEQSQQQLVPATSVFDQGEGGMGYDAGPQKRTRPTGRKSFPFIYYSHSKKDPAISLSAAENLQAEAASSYNAKPEATPPPPTELGEKVHLERSDRIVKYSKSRFGEPIAIFTYDFHSDNRYNYFQVIVNGDLMKIYLLEHRLPLEHPHFLASTTLFRKEMELLPIFYNHYSLYHSVEHFYFYYNGELNEPILHLYNKSLHRIVFAQNLAHKSLQKTPLSAAPSQKQQRPVVGVSDINKRITLVEWNFPYNLNPKEYYYPHFAQLGQMHHSLYKYGKGKQAEFMLFHDLDEFVYLPPNAIEIARSLKKKNLLGTKITTAVKERDAMIGYRKAMEHMTDLHGPPKNKTASRRRGVSLANYLKANHLHRHYHLEEDGNSSQPHVSEHLTSQLGEEVHQRLPPYLYDSYCFLSRWCRTLDHRIPIKSNLLPAQISCATDFHRFPGRAKCLHLTDAVQLLDIHRPFHPEVEDPGDSDDRNGGIGVSGGRHRVAGPRAYHHMLLHFYNWTYNRKVRQWSRENYTLFHIPPPPLTSSVVPPRL